MSIGYFTVNLLLPSNFFHQVIIKETLNILKETKNSFGKSRTMIGLRRRDDKIWWELNCQLEAKSVCLRVIS